MSSDAALSVRELGKSYRIQSAVARPTTMAEAVPRTGEAPTAPRRPRQLLGVERCVIRRRPGRGDRDHRTQRGGQEHAAESPEPHHRADARRGPGPRPRGLSARGRDRLPPRAHRSREHLPQRRDPGNEAERDHPPLRRHRGVLGCGAVPRHTGEAIQQRHVGPARVCRGRAPRARDPARRRGAWQSATPSSSVGASGR